MEKEILAKLESLKIYIPFIDYLLHIDEVKYVKLLKIKEWIVTKKRYPKKVLETMEQTMRTQYKNLFADDVKVPKEIMAIFNNTLGEVRYTTVNLCSSDEEDDDDDVEIVSSTLPEQTLPTEKKSINCAIKKPNPVASVTLDKLPTPLECPPCIPKNEEDGETASFLRQIDEIVQELNSQESDHLKYNKDDFDIPTIDNLVAKERYEDEKLFTRRDAFVQSSKSEKKTQLDKHSKHKSSIDKPDCPEAVCNDKVVDEPGSPVSTSAPDTDILLTKEDMEHTGISGLIEILKDLTKRNNIDLEKMLAAFTTENTDNEPNSSNSPIVCLDDDITVADSIPTANQPQMAYNDVQQPPQNNPPANPFPQQHQNATFYPPQTFAQPPPPRQIPRYILHDPRMTKFLENFKNSPLYSNKDREIAANLNWIGQQTQSGRHKQVRTTPQQPATYGEHKRQQAEKKRLEAERKERANLDAEFKAKERARLAAEREAREKYEIERKERARIEAERFEREKMEFELKQKEKSRLEAERLKKEKIENELKEKQKAKIEAERLEREKQIHTDSIRQILMSELKPYGDEIENMLRKPTTPDDYETANEQGPNGAEKGNRELNRLNCTVIGYNKMSDYVTKTIGGKRRSSMCARSEIAKQLNTNSANESSEEMAVNMEEIPCANLTSDDVLAPAKVTKRRKSAISDIQSQKCRKTSSTSADTRFETAETDTDDDTAISDFKKFQLEKQKSLALKYQPFVQLTRLTKAELAKYLLRRTRTSTETKASQNNEKILNVKLVENKSKTSNKQSKHLPATTTAKPVQKLKHTNIDLRMTERNTKFCKLCKAKPADLTNHYIRSHKTESYVSRLTLEELDDLQFNIPFGMPTAKSGNATKYKVKCPFCDDEIINYFNDLHSHYSTHTGEYAFQCSGCKLQKPFRVDILSHQNHSKICRNARVQNMYLYPSNLMVIYLHSCTLCSFVQLNEANVYKHLREHHGKRSDDNECVQKYILAAINDDESASSNRDSQSPEKRFDALPESDDGIIVSNEPIHEDSFNEEKPLVEDLMKDLFSSPEQDYSFEIGASKPNTTTPAPASVENNISATGIICNDISMAPMGIVSVQLHLPMQLHESEDIKPDVNELQKKINTQAEVGEQNQVDMKAFEKQETELNPPRTQPTTKSEISTTAVVPLTSPNQTPSTSPPLTQAPHHRNAPNKHYREFPKSIPYFGLFKCMANDCFYSTDVDSEILHHLKDHIDSECPPQGVLDCAYCQLDAGQCTSPDNLVSHLRIKHLATRFQCTSCCYRSCVPGNVKIHHQLAHQGSEDDLCDWVYECEGPSVAVDDRLPQIMAAALENVKTYTCAYCSTGFFASRFMKEHLRNHHQILNIDPNTLPRYACIYCPLNLSRTREMQEHIAAEHPGELAYACERVLKRGLEVDSVHNLVLNDISLAVPPEAIKSAFVAHHPILAGYIKQPTTNGSTETQSHTAVPSNSNPNETEVKPSAEEIIRISVDTLKPLLVKITSNTGVSPDRLYHCPVASCGGFFSVYMLWSRHMTTRHKCLLPTCPHCPEDISLSLQAFEQHFEQHCRHLFLCFHCGESFVNEQQLRQHAAATHASSPEVRLEKIPFNISYSYTVLIDKDLHTDRLKFLLELKEVIWKRLKQMEEEESQKFRPQWQISQSNSSSWLEEFPSFQVHRNVDKKCFVPGCLFRSPDEVALFEHLNSHPVAGNLFKCSKCTFRKYISDNWDVVAEHVKVHNANNIYICSVCRYYHYDRHKLTEHIKALHNVRDVPVVSLFRTEHSICFTLSVVFAASRKSFSTMSNCFCCIRDKLGPETFAMHLKKDHKLRLCYFCELCNESLPQLQQSMDHFTSKHSGETLKIYCQLASRTQVSLMRVHRLQVHLEGDEPWSRMKRTLRCEANDDQPFGKNAKTDPNMTIKKERDDDDDDSDDCVMILEEDDVAILEESKACRIKQGTVPPQQKLHCVNIKNLLQSPKTNIPAATTEISQNPTVPSTISPARVTIKLPMKISELQKDTFLSGCQGTIEFANSNNGANKTSPFSIKYITKPTSAETLPGTTSVQGCQQGSFGAALPTPTPIPTQNGYLLHQQFDNPINTFNTPNYGLNNRQCIPQQEQRVPRQQFENPRNTFNAPNYSLNNRQSIPQQQQHVPHQQSPASSFSFRPNITHQPSTPRPQEQPILDLHQHSPTSYSVNFRNSQEHPPCRPVVLRQQLPSTSVTLPVNPNDRQYMAQNQQQWLLDSRQQPPPMSTVNVTQMPMQGQLPRSS